jgi:hypothetical protein
MLLNVYRKYQLRPVLNKLIEVKKNNNLTYNYFYIFNKTSSLKNLYTF